MKICVLGAGAWGTALAVNAAGRHAVTLWARDAAQAQAMSAARENQRYLPGIALPPSLSIRSGDALAALAGADLAIVATPMAALREQLRAAARCGASGGLALQGRRAGARGAGRRRAAGPRDPGRRRARPDGRRAERPELCAGGRARPADGAGRRQSPSAAARCAGRGLPRPDPARLCQRRHRRRRGRRRRQERAGDRDRPGRRPGARPQCARRA